MKAFFTLSAIALCACAPGQINLNNLSATPDATIFRVVDCTLELAPKAIDVSAFTLTVHATLEASIEACQDDLTGCIKWEDNQIHTPWPSEFPNTSPEVINANAAKWIAHELGHVYYEQTTGNSDHDHEHQSEWFDVYAPGSIENLIYTRFYTLTPEND